MNRYENISASRYSSASNAQGFLPFPPIDGQQEGYPPLYHGKGGADYKQGYDPVTDIISIFSGTIVNFREKGRPIDEIFPLERNGRIRVPAARPARQSPT